MNYTIGTLYSGGEGVGVGARAAGFRHLWGIEYKQDVAQVAEANGFRSIVSDAREMDPMTLERPYLLHASPPCLDASGANGNRTESAAGLEMGMATARFIRVLQPEVFTLENVFYYRNYDGFKAIVTALFDLGYMVDVQHLNAADYGVPQTRQRLVLRAARNRLLPMLPEPEPWRGWFSAIADLIPTLPETELAPWQLERLPAGIAETMLIAQGMRRRDDGEFVPSRTALEPSLTITSNTNQLGLRAVLVPGGGNTGYDTARLWKGMRGPEEPATTVTSLQGGGSLPRAVLIDGANANQLTMRDAGEPSHTITANGHKVPTRAVLVGSQYGQPNTVERREVQCRELEQPSFTITASDHGDKRICLDRRVVQLSVRALARLQTFPDSYELPEKRSLACYVIGNAVPPLMYEKIAAQFRE